MFNFKEKLNQFLDDLEEVEESKEASPEVAADNFKAKQEELSNYLASLKSEKETVAAAPVISQDKDTRNSKGVMVNSENSTTRFEMSQLPQEIAREVNKLQPGEISKPFIMKDQKLNRDVVAIIKLTNRIGGHKANLSDDYQLIKSMHEKSAKAKIIAEWIDKKIADTYIRIEDGWDNCQFEHNWLKK